MQILSFYSFWNYLMTKVASIPKFQKRGIKRINVQWPMQIKFEISNIWSRLLTNLTETSFNQFITQSMHECECPGLVRCLLEMAEILGYSRSFVGETFEK
jgi:hypothetical protein